MTPQKFSFSAADGDVSAGGERLASLFQPDILASDQYFDNLRGRAGLEPETRLMLAVLEDAVDCYRDNILPRDQYRQHLFDETKDWIQSSEDDWLFSFESICAVLGVNAAYLRQGLLRFGPAAANEPRSESRKVLLLQRRSSS